MTKSIAFFQFSTEEDLSFVLEFSGLVLTGRDFEIKITERSSNTTKATLTNGAGITVTGTNVLEAYLAKADMVGWARGEYSADVVDISGGGASRIQAVRFDYNLPGRLVQGVQDRKAYISWSPNQAVVTSTGAIGPKGAKGDKGDTGEQGEQGETGPPGTIAVGDVTTGAAGSEASVTNVGTPTAAIFDFEIPEGAQGIQGVAGNKGWSPTFAVVTDGARRVLQVDDWAGGEGSKPAVGDYVGATGLTPTIGDAVDIRGPAGTATIPDGDKGDVTTADSGDTWTLNDGAVDLDKFEASVYADQPTAEGRSDTAAIMHSLAVGQSITVNAEGANFTPDGAGAVVRSLRNKSRDNASPADYSTLQAAIDARRNVEGTAGASYTHTGVTLSNSESFDGKNAVITAGVGASIYTLTDYAPVLERVYIADNLASTQCAIKASAARYPQVRYVISPNTGAGGIELKPSSGYTALADFSGVTFEGLTGTGISIGSSVNEIRASHVYIAGKLDYDGGGLARPKAGTVGWRQNTPVVGGLAVGGHQITAGNMICVDTGWWLTNAQLSNYQGCIADSTRGYGIVVDGASDKITFCNTFVGASMGIRVAGTSLNIKFDGLETRLIGQTPPWGQTPFYNSSGPFYAVTVEDTAKVTINGDNWTGTKSVSVASGASLTVTGGFWFRGRNSANIAAGATAYLADKEYAAQADAVMRAPFTGHLFFGVANISVAPGTGETITFTAQVNGVDTALSFSISGTSTFINQMYGPIFVTKGQTVNLKVVKSAGANANGRYNFDVQMLAD